ncbi:OsmC family protein [Legionella jamestowniensis]|uniref:Peroxiredoxin OsmC n=1 Tax=Legionella jamestowniensis TaxID=455 RepID=A0A0W0UGP8_9GAMM|nr:OsmC family protein [Legionella jamestowniensis]KTD07011.1 Peroxiredoxin OsmC [Legionella jamestowniensis]SFM03777.1 osmotically inducible protein OsmC [Legionella jamestowniensis DSM 19215]
MKRQGSAQWQGGIKDGQGILSTESGVLNKTQYSFTTRFEQEKGTNPEELIAAAHAGCFSMAFAAQLEKEGLKAEKIHTVATVSLEKSTEGFSIPSVHLNVKAKIPNVNAEAFEIAANTAKENCPVSRLFNAKITMDASLEN